MEPHNTDTFGAEPHAGTEDAQRRARAAAADVQHAVREQAESLRRDAQARSTEFLEDKKMYAAGELSDVAQALRYGADSLRQQQHDQAGRYVNLAADSLEQFAGVLRQRDVGRLARDAGELARRQPGVFLGGAVAAGFLLSRFMKASSTRLHDEPDSYAHPDERPSTPQATYTDPVGAPDAPNKSDI